MNGAPLSVSVRAIADIVCDARKTPRSMLMSYRRGAGLAELRYIVMWLAARHTAKSQSEIGRILGRDHTTVIHGLATIEDKRERDASFAAELKMLDARVVAVAEAVEFGGPPIPPDVDAYDVAQRIVDTPRGAIRVSVLDIEALAAAVLAGVRLRNAVVEMLKAETIDAATAAVTALIDHVTTSDPTEQRKST